MYLAAGSCMLAFHFLLPPNNQENDLRVYLIFTLKSLEEEKREFPLYSSKQTFMVNDFYFFYFRMKVELKDLIFTRKSFLKFPLFSNFSLSL